MVMLPILMSKGEVFTLPSAMAKEIFKSLASIFFNLSFFNRVAS